LSACGLFDASGPPFILLRDLQKLKLAPLGSLVPRDCGGGKVLHGLADDYPNSDGTMTVQKAPMLAA